MGWDRMGWDRTEQDGTGQGRIGKVVRDETGWVGAGRWFQGSDSMVQTSRHESSCQIYLSFQLIQFNIKVNPHSAKTKKLQHFYEGVKDLIKFSYEFARSCIGIINPLLICPAL